MLVMMMWSCSRVGRMQGLCRAHASHDRIDLRAVESAASSKNKARSHAYRDSRLQIVLKVGGKRR